MTQIIQRRKATKIIAKTRKKRQKNDHQSSNDDEDVDDDMVNDQSNDIDNDNTRSNNHVDDNNSGTITKIKSQAIRTTASTKRSTAVTSTKPTVDRSITLPAHQKGKIHGMIGLGKKQLSGEQKQRNMLIVDLQHREAELALRIQQHEFAVQQHQFAVQQHELSVQQHQLSVQQQLGEVQSQRQSQHQLIDIEKAALKNEQTQAKTAIEMEKAALKNERAQVNAINEVQRLAIKNEQVQNKREIEIERMELKNIQIRLEHDRGDLVNDIAAFKKSKVEFDNDITAFKKSKIEFDNDITAFKKSKIEFDNNIAAFKKSKIEFDNERITFENEKVQFEQSKAKFNQMSLFSPNFNQLLDLSLQPPPAAISPHLQDPFITNIPSLSNPLLTLYKEQDRKYDDDSDKTQHSNTTIANNNNDTNNDNNGNDDNNIMVYGEMNRFSVFLSEQMALTGEHMEHVFAQKYATLEQERKLFQKCIRQLAAKQEVLNEERIAFDNTFHREKKQIDKEKKRIKIEQETMSARLKYVTKREEQLAKYNTPLVKEQLIAHDLENNCDAWKVIYGKYIKKKADADKKNKGKPESEHVKVIEPAATICYKVVNVDKQLIVSSHFSEMFIPFCDIFHVNNHGYFAVWEHCFKRDYDDGIFPPKNDKLKLFVQSEHVLNNEWIQIYGPGTSLPDDIVLSDIVMCDPNKPKLSWGVDNSDRCSLSKEECKKQHKSTDFNYKFFHSDPRKQYSYNFVIHVKWEIIDDDLSE